MAEPRARPRKRGETFAVPDISTLLYAFGDVPPPHQLHSTQAVFDEILTDFIIETCHYAALTASYSRRQKIKVDDFKFVLRRDGVLLGRVLEQLWKDKGMKQERRAIDFEKVGGEGANAEVLAGLAEAGGVGSEMAKPGRRGRRKKRKAEDEAGGQMKRQET